VLARFRRTVAARHMTMSAAMQSATTRAIITVLLAPPLVPSVGVAAVLLAPPLLVPAVEVVGLTATTGGDVMVVTIAPVLTASMPGMPPTELAALLCNDPVETEEVRLLLTALIDIPKFGGTSIVAATLTEPAESTTVTYCGRPVPAAAAMLVLIAFSNAVLN